jgi:RHS repeat-associated protein
MKFLFLRSLPSLILVFSASYCYAQICCDQSPPVGSQREYTYNNGTIVFNPSWYLNGQGAYGTIISQTQNGTEYKATINWHTVGNETLVFFDGQAPLAQLNISILAPPPPVPVATAATNVLNNSFTANWQPATGAASYRLDVSNTNNPFSPNVLSNATTSATNFNVGSLAANTTYWYRVRSANTGGVLSGYSTPLIQVTTGPAVPTPSTGNVTYSSFGVSWPAVTSATIYYVEVSTDPNFTSPPPTPYSTTSTSITVSPLNQNTTYYYRVRAENSNGKSNNSSPIQVTTPYAPPIIGEPTSITSNSFIANWSAVSGATAYLVDVYDGSGTYVLQNYSVSGGATSALVSPVLAGTTYNYRVRAQNSGWTTDYSTVKTLITIPNPPSSVFDPNPSVTTASSFIATWSTSTGALSGYQVLLTTTSGSYNPPSVGTIPSSDGSATITGLLGGTRYYYVVQAGNSSGWSANSAEKNVLTRPDPPITNLGTNMTVSSFTASWSPVLSAASYDLEVSIDNFSTVLLTFSGLTVTTKEVMGLTTGTTYYYRVRANNATGPSVYSTPVTVATALVAPLATKSTAITSSSFTANWNSSTGATSYRLDVATDIGFLNILPAYNDLVVNNTSQLVSGLLPKKSYYYRVRAFKLSNSLTSAHSNYILGIDLDHNYVRTIDVLVPNKTTYTAAESGAITERISVHNFFDGLGRPLQTVTNQTSAAQKDLVQPFAYDVYGREIKKYLPYTDVNETNGWYKPNALRDPNSTGTAQAQYMTGKQYPFYQTGGNIPVDTVPYSRVRFETSPLNRPIEQASAGDAWRPDATDSYSSTDRTVKSSYETNEGATEVLLWTYTYPSPTYLLGLVNTGTGSIPAYYPVDQLYRTRTKNEDRYEVIEYKDKMGRVVLKRVQSKATSPVLGDTDYASTYYIYDGFGNLVVVIPPEATKRLATEYYQSGSNDASKDSFLRRWAFRYTYDAQMRMSQKQVPGAAPVYMVYDGRDRVVLTQDGNQRTDASGNITKKDWTYTKYDAINRPIITGIYNHSSVVDQAAMQTYVNGQMVSGNQFYEDYNSDGTYTTRVFPTTTPNLQTVNYYDNYNFRSQWLQTLSYNYAPDTLSQTVPPMATPYTHPGTENVRVVGKPTGKKVKVLDGEALGGYTWLKSATYYDGKYRVIQSKEDNYKGGIDRTSTLFDFPGKPLIVKTSHLDADVTWKDMVGLKQIGNMLYRTVADSSWGVSGAASVQRLAAGQNGWLEVVISEKNKRRMIGLCDVNSDASYTSMDYAWYPTINNSELYIYESGTNRGLIGNYKSGDVLKIERTGTVINYYQNNVLKFTSSVASSTVLMADVAIYKTNATVTNVRSSFSSIDRIVTRRMEYDNNNRLVRTWHRIGKSGTGTEYLLSHNTYNELGQLVDKKLHSTNSGATDAKQSIDYLYNIRGWLTKINNSDVSTVAAGDAVRDYFGMELGYNGAIGMGNVALYNGNISGMKWSVNQGHGTIKEIGYRYTYDPMNRLLKADHRQLSGTWQPGQFHEKGFTYDLNGNILTLGRYAEIGQIDTLKYDYGSGTTGSNKLLYVEDKTVSTVNKAKGFIDGNPGTGTDYIYDANGNMSQDRNKGIGPTAGDIISYNFLNLPETVIKGGNNIRYIYDATGRKLAQVLNTAATGVIAAKHTDYAGEFIYENDVLQFINHEEGRITVGSNKVIVKDAGESISTMTTTGGPTLATYNNTTTGEKYVTVQSNGVALSGISAVGGTLVAGPNERYRIRVKGYSVTNAVHISIKTNIGSLNWPGYPLPKGAVNESWVEQIVTTPAGTTWLTVGVTFNTSVGNPETFYVNEVEVTKLVTGAPEYQYHIKDHLGNVRVTFTSKNETESVTATLETAAANADQANFLRYTNAKRVNATIFDRTNGASTGFSQRLSGRDNEKYGLARSIAVMPGDVINMEVHAKYVDTNTANWTAALNTLMGQIAANTAGVVVDGASYSTSTSSFPFAGLINTTGSTGGPKAYLNWIFFDKNWTFVPALSGYRRMTTIAREYGQDVIHEPLTSTVTANQAGYMYIYLSNEESPTTPIDVYFDDFKVEQVKLPVVQSNDYYPFGLTYNSYQRESSLVNDWRFQGQENVDDLGLNWDSFKWRNHQPDLGRFFNVDPLADKYVYNSPFAFSENHVVAHRELEGLEKLLVTNYSQQQSSEIANKLQEKREVLSTPVTPSSTRSDKLDVIEKNNAEVERIVDYGSEHGFKDNYLIGHMEEDGLKLPDAVKLGQQTTTIEVVDHDAEYSMDIRGVVPVGDKLQIQSLGEVNPSKETSKVNMELGKSILLKTLENVIEYFLTKDAPVEMPQLVTPPPDNQQN